METSDANKPRRIRRAIGWLRRQTVRFLALVGLVSIVYHSCFDFSRITSISMEPTLQGSDWNGGDRVVTEKISYLFRQPRRWEIITFRTSEGMKLMKRVIALPGERIQMIRGGCIFINGEELKLPDDLKSLRYFPFGNLVGDKEYLCEDGYYVMGDYSRDSDDSRFNGPVTDEYLIGRAIYIYHPSERRQFLTR